MLVGQQHDQAVLLPAVGLARAQRVLRGPAGAHDVVVEPAELELLPRPPSASPCHRRRGRRRRCPGTGSSATRTRCCSRRHRCCRRCRTGRVGRGRDRTRARTRRGRRSRAGWCSRRPRRRSGGPGSARCRRRPRPRRPRRRPCPGLGQDRCPGAGSGRTSGGSRWRPSPYPRVGVGLVTARVHDLEVVDVAVRLGEVAVLVVVVAVLVVEGLQVAPDLEHGAPVGELPSTQ